MNSLTGGSFSIYIPRARYVLSIWQTCSVSISQRLRSKLFAKNVSFTGIVRALALSLITSVIFFAEEVFENTAHFKNYLKRSLPKLKWTRNFLVSIAFTKCTRDTRFTTDMAFDAGSPVKWRFIVARKWMERVNKGKKGQEKKNGGYRRNNNDFWNQIEMECSVRDH